MKKIIIFFVFLSLVTPVFVGAVDQNTGGKQPTPVMAVLKNPLDGVESIGDLFYKIVNYVMSLSYVVIAFFLLLSGFKFVTAQGSDDKLTEAKQTFFYTIIGALILIGANTIIKVVQGIISGLQG